MRKMKQRAKRESEDIRQITGSFVPYLHGFGRVEQCRGGQIEVIAGK